MLEGLPPNNAAHRLTLVTDEKRARAVADLIVESFEPAEAASTAFETEDLWPGGGKAWLVEAYFGFAPDEDEIRALIAVAADEETARAATFGVTEKQDWVANALAGLQPVRAGRFLVHGRHDRARVQAQRRRDRDRGGARLRHRPSRHDPRLPPPFRPAAQAPPARSRVLDVGCGAGVLAIAAAKVLRRKVWLGDIDPVAVEVANANARLNGVGQFCKAIVSRGVENRLLREGAPYDLVFANILAKPLRLLAPSLASVTAPDGEAIVSGLSSPTSPACSPPGGRRAFFSPSGSISRAGRACGSSAVHAVADRRWPRPSGAGHARLRRATNRPVAPLSH